MLNEDILLLFAIADMIAIPDYPLGAMENWGLVTYRETALLYQPSVSTESNKQRIVTVVAHEFSHQVLTNCPSLIFGNFHFVHFNLFLDG